MSDAGAVGRARKRRRPWHKLPGRVKRKFLFRAFGVAVAVLAVGLLVRYATQVDWDGVMRSLRRYQAPELALALGFVALSHLAYGAYDLIGRAYTNHKLPRGLTYAVALVGYAFNLSVGSMIGGAASRFRMYTRLGLATPTVARILALTVATNWLGYTLLAGAAFVAQVPPTPEDWTVGRRALQAIGVLLLGVAFAYLMLCAYAVRRSYTIRTHTLILPKVQLALWQFALGLCNWAAVGAVLYVLFDAQVPYLTVLGVLFLGVVATLVVRVPAGIGPLDAVFLALLTRQLPHTEVIAALLAYRAVYYLVPLALASIGYAIGEISRRGAAPVAAPKPRAVQHG